jgi:hypothetical protein
LSAVISAVIARVALHVASSTPLSAATVNPSGGAVAIFRSCS